MICGRFRKTTEFRIGYWVLMLSFGLAAFLISILPAIPNAADYPSKPIQIIVAFPPGGGSDIIARLVSEKVSALIGQPVVVVNKPGGGGTIGTYAALAAPLDGYTVLVISSANFLAPLITKGVTYNILRDFTPINLAVTAPNVVVVKKDALWQSFEELIADAKKNPGKITCSITGSGASAHFAAELIKIYAGIDFTLVPMGGVAPANTAILGGHVHFGTPEIGGSTFTYLKAGSFRGLAVMAKKRHKDFPDLPTTMERGYPTIINAVLQGFVVRSGTPLEIVEKLDKVFKEAFKNKEVIEKLENTGWVVENLGSKEMTEFLANEQQKCMEVAKIAKITPN